MCCYTYAQYQLCFAECYVLQAAGCVLWDLGGYDLCPIMQCVNFTYRIYLVALFCRLLNAECRYKLDLAGMPQARNIALQQFREAQVCASSSLVFIGESNSLQGMGDADGMRRLRSGSVLIEDVTQDTLVWSRSGGGASC